MTTRKKRHRSKFKAEIALKALSHPLEIDVIAQDHDITIDEVIRWRDQLQEGAVSLFKDDGAVRLSRASKEKRKKWIRRGVLTMVTLGLVYMIVRFAVNMAMSGGS